LGAALGEAIARGCSGIISFGIAGGLASDLAPGAWVVASGVVAAHKRYPTDRDWARRLLRALGSPPTHARPSLRCAPAASG
jgi:hypothetical protein